ncbi:MAG: VUT family protein [Acidobacteria bacterium]|nr:MAG: VUT family protein [Acidobacteriota bacterium]
MTRPGHSPGSYSSWFLLLVALSVTTLITANVIGSKLVRLGDYVLPAGILIFPLSYIIGDVLTEVYGYRLARRVIWLGFFCNLLAVTAIWAAGAWPPAGVWRHQRAYEAILGYTPRLVAASFLAYLVGEFSNSFVLARLKVLSGGRKLWLRTIGSTIVGQGFDSLIFVGIAFAGTVPTGMLLAIALTQWIAKCLYEALLTPATYLVVNFLKRQEGLDTYDYATSFNPLSLE